MTIPDMYSSEEAIFLAAMLNQAYRLFEQEQVVMPQGYTLRYNILALAGVEEPEQEVFGFIAESKDRVVITFRGTRTFKDNESDQDFFQIPYPYVSNAGKTHRGFTCIYKSAREGLIGVLNTLSAHKRLFVAGHSLGGALAVLAALDIAVNTGYKRPVVYTYGSPRVADPECAAFFNRTVISSFRIVNIHDIIPTLPAKAYPPPITQNGLFYRHVNWKVPLAFQLNSLPVRNHEIVCYFIFLSRQNPGYTDALCADNPGLCPDTALCIPFIGTCGAEKL